MKYLLLIYADENAWTDAERQACYGESTQLAHNLKENGQFISTSPLQPVATATCVKVRESKRVVTDGPFAEAREQLGGYFMIEAKNLDEAIDVAGADSGRTQRHGRNPAGSGDPEPAGSVGKSDSGEFYAKDHTFLVVR